MTTEAIPAIVGAAVGTGVLVSWQVISAVIPKLRNNQSERKHHRIDDMCLSHETRLIVVETTLGDLKDAIRQGFKRIEDRLDRMESNDD